MSRRNESRPAPGGGPDGGSTQLTGGALDVIVPRTGVILSADASVYAPVGARRLHSAAARCPHCGGVTVHRGGSPEALDGALRVGACGHRYLIHVRRTYRAREGAA